MAYGFKTGGRQKGTLNKTTQLQREKLQAAWQGELDSGKLREALNQLSPKDYVWAFLRITSFILPRATDENMMEFQVSEPVVVEQPQPEIAQNTENSENAGNSARQSLVMEMTPEILERMRTEMGWSQEQLDNHLRTGSVQKN